MAGQTQANSFDPSDLTVKEVKDLQGVTGRKFGQVVKDFRNEDFDAETVQAIIWLFKRREQPELTYEQAENEKINILFNQNGDATNPPA